MDLLGELTDSLAPLLDKFVHAVDGQAAFQHSDVNIVRSLGSSPADHRGELPVCSGVRSYTCLADLELLSKII